MTAPQLPEPEDEGRLSPQDREVLEGIAGHENAADPRFVLAMSSAATPVAEEADAEQVRARAVRRDRAIQVAVVLAVAAVLLPTDWVLAVALVALLVVGPAVLAVIAVRRGALPGASATPDRRADPDGPRDR